MSEVDTIDVVDQASTTRTVATISKLIKSIGLPADAKSNVTDTTPATHISILKQLSAYLALFVYGGGNQAAALRTTLATDSPGVTALGQTTASASLPVVVASDQALAHGTTDAGGLFGIGFQTIAHGTNPTQVAAAKRSVAYANRHGIPFVIAGHPNIITRSNKVLASDGAQTDAALVSVAAGLKIVLTQISVVCDAANTVNVAVRIGFGTATIPASALAGTAAIVLEGNFAPGAGIQKGNGAGMIAVGADDFDLRLTCGSPTGGTLWVSYSYYTIES